MHENQAAPADALPPLERRNFTDAIHILETARVRQPGSEAQAWLALVRSCLGIES